MSDRLFIKATGIWNGIPRHGLKVECADCGTSLFYSENANREANRLSRGADKYFRAAGWQLGAGPRNDKCRACVAKRKGEKPKLTVVPRVTAETPVREMSRDDRRIVFAKIDEVYLGEGNGYSGDWTDDLVAKDMGVPRAWVSKVREEMFGPAIKVKDTDTLRRDIESVIEDRGKLASQIEEEIAASKDLKASLESHLAAMGRLLEKDADVRAHLQDLSKRTVQLEKVAKAG